MNLFTDILEKFFNLMNGIDILFFVFMIAFFIGAFYLAFVEAGVRGKRQARIASVQEHARKRLRKEILRDSSND